MPDAQKKEWALKLVDLNYPNRQRPSQMEGAAQKGVLLAEKPVEFMGETGALILTTLTPGFADDAAIIRLGLKYKGRYPRVAGAELAALRREFDQTAKPGYWREYARQVDDGAVSNPFGNPEVNLARMRDGLPPVGPEGVAVPLHHKIPLSRGGTNEFSNLQPISQYVHQKNTKILHSEPFPGVEGLSKYQNQKPITQPLPKKRVNRR
ncbi:MAG: HNH/ENDO VII family nuclease [Acidobacteriota bacterium]